MSFVVTVALEREVNRRWFYPPPPPPRLYCIRLDLCPDNWSILLLFSVWHLDNVNK